MKVLTTELDQCGEQFTLECLQGLVDKFDKPLNVYTNFEGDPIGKVTKLELKDNAVWAEFELDVESHGYLVPSGFVDENYSWIAIAAFGVVKEPCDSTLEELK